MKKNDLYPYSVLLKHLSVCCAQNSAYYFTQMSIFLYKRRLKTFLDGDLINKNPPGIRRELIIRVEKKKIFLISLI
jgi:hypothetical protein